IEEQDLTREEVKSMLIKALERERELIFDSGKKEGYDLGKKETLEARNRQIARNMAGQGFPLATIAQLLVLSVAEVEQFLTEPTPASQPPTR
ncbi:MAG: hypothetical protein ACOYNY_47825, partial [Caldilineaceae bacterium]